uniref:Large ribosomal subunit protein uL23m n=1 Tax=Salmo trutta TaxID=8032 RepID=A0A673VX42_SALTR
MAQRVFTYPLYQIGNPQLRIFRPPFSLTLVRPGKEQPQDTVQFRIPMEMTKCDVRNYLEKLYNVPVGAVRTRIQYCEAHRVVRPVERECVCSEICSASVWVCL